MVAKPIIDMVAVVWTITEAASVSDQLQRIGWVHAPEPFDEVERRLSFCYPSVARRTHHLHVVEGNFDGWREWVAFRDYLRAQPELCVEYGRLKTYLATEHGTDPNNRDAYRSGKAEWVSAVTRRAMADGRPL
ncbi:MAG: GrpB family protein [Acidimicrobiales bacterium]